MSSVPQTEDDHQYPQTLSVPTVFDMYWPRLQATRHKRHILKVLTVEFDVPVAGRAKTQLSSLVKARRNDDLYSLSDDRESVCGMGKLGKKTRNLQKVAVMPLKILRHEKVNVRTGGRKVPWVES